MLRFSKGGSVLTIERSLFNKQDYPDAWRITTRENGKEKHRNIKARGAAMRAYHELIQERQSAGYVLVVDDLPVASVTDAPFVELAEVEAAVDADPSNEAAWDEIMNAWVNAGDPRGAAMLYEHTRASVTPAEFLERKRAHEPVRRLRNAHTFGALGSDGYRVRATLQRGSSIASSSATNAARPGAPRVSS